MIYSKNKLRRVKPGRAPSFMGFIGSIIVIVVGIIWTTAVIYIGKKEGDLPVILVLFGIIFIIMGIANAVYSYYAFKGRISVFDIVDSSEEGEDLDFNAIRKERQSGPSNYCPYCGSSVEESFSFCPKCGKNLRRR